MWSWRFQHIERQKMLFIFLHYSIVAWVIVLLWYVYFTTIWSPKYTIDTIVFSEESVAKLSYRPLYTAVYEELHGRNYLRTKRLQLDALTEQLQQEHPLVAGISLRLQDYQTVLVSIEFFAPKVLFQTPTHYFASYKEFIYPLSSGSVLVKDLFPVQLPAFSSWRESINGVFWTIGENELVQSVELILQTLGPFSLSELIYQPGWKRLYVTYKDKRLYFNLGKPIQEQLEKILSLERNWPDFPSVWTFDLWSRDETIVQ